MKNLVNTEKLPQNEAKVSDTYFYFTVYWLLKQNRK
jgi:hypothetical protein